METTTDGRRVVAVRPSGARRRVVVALLVVLLGLAGLYAVGLLVPWNTETQTQDVPAAGVSRLVVRVNGPITVTAGTDPSTVRVTTTRRWSWFGEPSQPVALSSGGTLTLVGQCPRLVVRCQVGAEVVVPPSTSVLGDTSAGSVRIDGMTGGVDVRSSAGSIAVHAVSGTVALRTSAGSITGDLAGPDVQATTSAGGITLTLTAPVDRLTATTSAGSIDLTVPDDAYRVQTDTSAGSADVQVRTDPDATRRITARSSAGSIVVRRST